MKSTPILVVFFCQACLVIDFIRPVQQPEFNELTPDDPTEGGESGATGSTGSTGSSGPTGTSGPVPAAWVLGLGSLSVGRVTDHGFLAELPVTNDTNGNAQVTLRLCNRTDAPGCDPSSGAGVGMLRVGQVVFAVIDELEPPDDGGDLLAVVVEATDPDGLPVLQPGAALTASVRLATARHLYRSVGTSATAVAAGSPALKLDVTGRFARFSSPLPDGVGVGDALVYDSDGDALVDALAIVHARHGSEKLSVRAPGGGAANQTLTATQDFEIRRAYLRLQDTVTATENAYLPAPLRNFDTWSASFDLVGANVAVHFACYDGPPDTGNSFFPTTWVTGPANGVHIFTPFELGHVGTSQRHDGTFNRGYRRSNELRAAINHLWIEGLAIETTDNRGIFIYQAPGPELAVDISDTIVHLLGPAGTAAFDTYDNAGAQTSNGNAIYRLWNDVAVVDQAGDGFLMNDDWSTYLMYSLTAAVLGPGSAFLCSPSGHPSWTCVLRNALGYAPSGNTFQVTGGIDHCAANDAPGLSFTGDPSNRSGQAFTFRGVSDYRLSPADAGARGRGANLTNAVQFSFSRDVEGEKRPEPPAAWDIGADQTPPAD
ncbi:MAG: hypothetical protein IT381_13825 [Deltaproteobacteria bacterium]|nr:hypothetical protein [Deltaproteobacteria bacterium]